jgi:isoleucyl-tRNA synthetase
LYANLDGFDFSKELMPLSQRTESDRWIISRLHTMSKEAEQAYESYEPTKAARAIQSFVIDDLSNWYVRLNRKRFWVGEYNENKEAAYQTLYTCLKTVSKLMAPIAPFYAEKLFMDLNAVSAKDNEISVHLTQFPKADESSIDEELEARMHLAQLASSLVHSLRKKEKIKVRQPLQKILIPILYEGEKERLKLVEELIISETNVKEVEYLDDTSGVFSKKIKPNFRKLGSTYGAKLKQITPLINSMDQDQIREFESKGSFALNLDNEKIELSLDDVEISTEDVPGWLVASEDGFVVALDITITDELKQEGLARDLINRIQNLRKDKKLEVQDKINVTFDSSDKMMRKSIEQFGEYIQRETQTLSLNHVKDLKQGDVLDIDGIETRLVIEVNKG